MQLHFLGASYEPQQSAIDTVNIEVEGHFLGRSYRKTRTMARPLAGMNQRKYRGISY